MLGRQGIVSEDEKNQIIAGLEEIRKDIADGKIVFTVEDEDIHMGIESRLIARIGDVGKKLHTSRSRNDNRKDLSSSPVFLSFCNPFHRCNGQKANGHGKEYVLIFRIPYRPKDSQIKGNLRQECKKEQPQFIFPQTTCLSKAFHQQKAKDGESNPSDESAGKI